jgi:putative ABC transport system permease protein
MLPVSVREFLLGDLDEQFAVAATEVGRVRARRQYWSQALRAIWHAPAFARRARQQALPVPRRINMAAWVRDLLLGVRTAVRSPSYSVITALTLALAIGANTLLFSIANPLLIRSLPFKDSSRLAWIIASNPQREIDRALTSVPDFLEWRAGMRSYQSLGAFEIAFGTLTGHGDAKRIQISRATANLLDVWGMSPARGRWLQPGEDAVGRDPVGVISYRYWHEEFQGDPSILGRTFLLDGKTLTIVGIMPSSIELGNFSLIDIWVPLPLDPSTARDRRVLRVCGRLAPGTTVESADAELQTILASQGQARPEGESGWQTRVVSNTQAIASKHTWVILGLLGVIVVFVLLIACANLANLVLARLVVRRQELAVRVALGASKWRLVRPLLLESLILSVAGGLLGLTLAAAGLRIINAAASEPFLRMIGVDRNVLAFNILLSFVTPLLFTLWPALSASRSVTAEMLHGARTSGGRKAGRRRDLLVGSQVALALSLLVVSGLVVQSMLYLRHIDWGFDVPKLLTYTYDLPANRYADDGARVRFARNLETELAVVPGVTGAGIASHIPVIDFDRMKALSGTLHDGAKESEKPWASWFAVSAGYFKASGIRVLAGRGFERSDTTGGEPVAILNQMAADRYFDGAQSAVGRRITIHDDATGDRRAAVVGVVTDTRDAQLIRTSPQIYVDFDQWPVSTMTVVVRSDDPGGRARDVQAVMRRLDPTLAVSQLKTMSRVVQEEMASADIINGLFVAFAVLALALAAAGLFGVTSYSVGQRRREIGIRLALGASPSKIGRMVVTEGLRVVAIGMAVGLVLAFVLARASTSLLYGISAGDPSTFIAVTTVILLVTVFAAWAPATRAMRTDPARTLRAE